VFTRALEPLYGAFRTVALSADGRKVALLRKGALEVYELPPVEETRKHAEENKKRRSESLDALGGPEPEN
jgi:hypothetical protein